jgi:hypothetical protein
MAEPWADTFSIRLPLACCPFCDATERVRVRTNVRGDGATERLCVCRQCSRRYRIIVDPALPLSGMLPSNTRNSNRIQA